MLSCGGKSNRSRSLGGIVVQANRQGASGSAGRAHPRNEDGVIFDHKALGCVCVVIERASGQLIDTIAATAVKMVVMAFAAPFVQRSHGGMVDLNEPAFIEQ
jgi:hypothetical protein